MSLLELTTLVKKRAGVSAVNFLPAENTHRALEEAARGCRRCPLYQHATQTVFGEGPPGARVMLVGEQPGNEEDRQGHPFVGPAGRVLDEGLEQAGISRNDAYVTNVVKHFKWEPEGKRRLHKKPNAAEIGACLPWLEREVELVRPEVLICLGATAAQALLGRTFRVSVQHGMLVPSPLAPHSLATVHPSSILRQQTREERERAMRGFVADLRVAAGILNHR